MNWRDIQCGVWRFDACHDVISLAPPYAANVVAKTKAASATGSESDKLRMFLEEAFNDSWQAITDRGVTLLHAVKCAIVPSEGGFQNPPAAVVDRCAPVHLAAELVVTLGQMGYRAFCRAANTVRTSDERLDLRLSAPPPDAQRSESGQALNLGMRRVTLFASPFPRASGRVEATATIRHAARHAGVALGEVRAGVASPE